MWWNPLVAPTLVVCAIFFWVIYVPYALYSGVRSIQSGERIFLMLMGIAILCTCWLGFIGARQSGTSYLLSLLAIIWMSDIGAYFIGRAYGQKKLAPQISPGKTIEGALGGAVLALIFVILLSLSHTAEPTFFGAAVARHGWLSAIFLTLLTISAGIMGDLFESLLKRQANVKDSGHFLPGHGGILDRIDALLPAIPLALLLNHLG
jgi:phosphatidate cytidylyltransferase